MSLETADKLISSRSEIEKYEKMTISEKEE